MAFDSDQQSAVMAAMAGDCSEGEERQRIPVRIDRENKNCHHQRTNGIGYVAREVKRYIQSGGPSPAPKKFLEKSNRGRYSLIGHHSGLASIPSFMLPPRWNWFR